MCSRKLWCCLPKDNDPTPICNFKFGRLSCFCCIRNMNISQPQQCNPKPKQDETDGCEEVEKNKCFRLSWFTQLFKGRNPT